MEYLHSKNIVYNNLKAENILLDIDGHIKLADFGLSTEILWDPSLTFTFGNADILNPEVARMNNIKKSPDFFSLGCLLYQMLTGSTIPKDLNSESPIHMPRYLSVSVKSLLEGLLCTEPQLRLGFHGMDSIKTHLWCEDINWARMQKKRIVPPFRPNLKISNFNPEVMAMPLNIEPLEIYETENFDFATENKERSYWNTPEVMLGDYNNVVFSERTSTDAEDTFNSLHMARSLDMSLSQQRYLENTESFTLPAMSDKEIEFKSLSPTDKGDKLGSIKSLLNTVTDIPKYFMEDYRTRKNIPLHIPMENGQIGKMKDCVRNKISLRRNV